MLYIIPEQGADERFTDLAALARRADELVAQTGEINYGIAYEWAEESALDNESDIAPPAAMLTRVDGRWVRREIVATPTPDGEFSLEFGDPAEVTQG